MSTRAEDVEGIARNAIAANWRTRNSRVFMCPAQYNRISRQRRAEIREWVAVLRIASDEGNLAYIRNRLAGTGPLMGHDLRNRVILAGLDRLSEAHARQPTVPA